MSWSTTNLSYLDLEGGSKMNAKWHKNEAVIISRAVTKFVPRSNLPLANIKLEVGRHNCTDAI